MSLSQPPGIRQTKVSAYRIPTESPESDGTLQWRSTALVLLERQAGATEGVGYSYADSAAARLTRNNLLGPLQN